jgi:hypothetical protein
MVVPLENDRHFSWETEHEAAPAPENSRTAHLCSGRELFRNAAAPWRMGSLSLVTITVTLKAFEADRPATSVADAM